MARNEEDAFADADLIPPGANGGGGVSGDAAALVAQGATLMRVENESMLAVAIQRPRDEEKVLKAALKELQLVPEEARRAYYAIPYRERQMDGSYKMVNVEGPSIKAAMALARRWGNCSVTARTLNEDATGADIAGIFVDFETNFRVERPMRVSKVQKKRNGGTYTLDPQKWLIAIQASASKAARNAALNGLPAYLVASYMRQAKTIAAGDPESKADPKKVDKVIEAFKRYDVALELLEKHLGAKRDEWMGDDLATLIGIGNALKDGQMTVADAFDLPTAEESRPAGPATATGGVTAEAILGGTAKGENGATPGAADKPAQAFGPECAGCGKPTPPCDAQDDEGRAWHSVCVEAVKKADAKAAAAPAKPRQSRLSE
jgi:hypothetical protein